MGKGSEKSPLQTAQLPDTARSDVKPDVVNSFEIPALKASTSHSRVAGYWDIHWLDQAREGLEEFILSGNQMKLLIGIPIAKSLDSLIKAEEQATDEKAANLLLQKMTESPDLSQIQKFDLLAWMLSQELIEVRILLVGHSDRKPIPEHAKIQIYSDSQNKVASSGSKNDTRRGNSQGVDFLVICKSWSSEESVKQIEGMEEYFNDHWNHPEVVELKDIKDNPEFMAKLRRLADEQQSEVTPEIKFIRDIGKLEFDNCEALLIQSKQNKYPSKIAKKYGQIDLITSEKPITKWHIDTLEMYVPLIQTVFILDQGESEKLVSNYDNKCFAFCWQQESQFDFHVCEAKAPKTSEGLDKESLDDLVLDHFEIQDIPEEEEAELTIVIPEIESTRKPTHPLVPDIIVNYPWGESLRPHHIRSLSGDVGEELIDTEQAITGGFLTTKSGIFEHATGSGKTGLGLIAAAHMLEDGLDFVVVVVPKIAIADQWWRQSLSWFNYQDSSSNKFVPLRSYTNSSGIAEKNKRLYQQTKINPNDWPIELINGQLLITVSNTFFDNLDRILECQDDGLKWGLIIDEAHRLVTNQDSKIDELNLLKPEYKLGLTAKFQHPQNSVGSQSVLDWIAMEDNHTDKFPLSSALRKKYLKPYEFIVHVMDAEEDSVLKKESQDYVVKNYSKLENGPTLLYVNENTVRELDKLMDRLTQAGHSPEKFTYNHQYKSSLELWADGAYNPMMSLNILDEGVDVPSCSAAILLDCSEKDDRQWIQRRGRTLRINPKKKDSVSLIHDFVPRFDPEIEWSIEWWERNVHRLLEFVQDASSQEVVGSEVSEISELCLRVSKEIADLG